MFIRRGTLAFAPTTFEVGPVSAEQIVNFPDPTVSAVPLLSGFDVQFVAGDKYLLSLDIDLQAGSLSEFSIEVTGELGLRDKSGDWDDSYGGSVSYAVVGLEEDERAAQGSLAFEPAKGFGPRSATEGVVLSAAGDSAATLLTGFLARFSEKDHPPLEIEVDLRSQSPAPGRFDVTGTYGLRDGSLIWDDPYDGMIRYAAMVPSTNGDVGVQIRTGRLDFAPHVGSGPLEQSMNLTFGRPVKDCVAVLTGFLVGYEKDNIYLHRLVAEVEASKLSNTDVEVVGRLGIRDKSNQWDDSYHGSLRFAVLGS